MTGIDCNKETQLNNAINSFQPANQQIARNLLAQAKSLKSSVLSSAVQTVRTSQASLFAQFQSVDPIGSNAFNSFLAQESSLTTCAQMLFALTNLRDQIVLDQGKVIYRKLNCYIKTEAKNGGKAALEQFKNDNMSNIITLYTQESGRDVGKLLQFLQKP